MSSLSAATARASVVQRIINSPLKDWKEADVHKWTSRMRQVMTTECPRLVNLTKEVMSGRDGTAAFDNRTRLVASVMMKMPRSADILTVLTKMRERIQVVDKDMYDLSPAGLLVIVVDMVQDIEHVNEEDAISGRHTIATDGAWMALYNTLLDMGATCIQGDTHRLFSLYIALIRDMVGITVDHDEEVSDETQQNVPATAHVLPSSFPAAAPAQPQPSHTNIRGGQNAVSMAHKHGVTKFNKKS